MVPVKLTPHTACIGKIVKNPLYRYFYLEESLSHQPFVRNYLVVNHHRNVVNDVHCVCPMILLS